MIDLLYQHIIDEAFPQKDGDGDGGSKRTDVLATVVCLQTPLSMEGIASLLDLEFRDVQFSLSPLQSVIRAPDNGSVSIFHASFPAFIIDPNRCLRHSVVASHAHHQLAIKYLHSLNTSLRRNICHLPEGRMTTLPHKITDASVIISETLRYSCLCWASHLSEALASLPADAVPMLDHLCTFANNHLLHWFECLSEFGELESGLNRFARRKKQSQ